MATYKRVCQGLPGEPCGEILEIATVPDGHPDAGKISHGYCSDCYHKWMAQIEAAKKREKAATHAA